MSDFGDHVTSYQREVRESVAFSGQEATFFHLRKAEALVGLADRLVGDPRTLRALDVGCGVGSIDRHLEGRFGLLCAVDPVPGAVGRGAADNRWVRYLSGDGLELPFAAGTFDVAFAVCVVHHVPPAHRDAFAREVARVVRPGGVVVIFEHNALNPLTRLAVSRCEFDEGVELLTRRATTRLLAGAGLAPAEARDLIFTPFDHDWARALDQALGRLPLGAQHYVAACRVGA